MRAATRAHLVSGIGVWTVIFGSAFPTLADGYPRVTAGGGPRPGEFARDHFAVVGPLASCSRAAAADQGRIMRGGAPTAAGIARLRALGVTTVIDLRTDGEAGREARQVAAAGMSYRRIAMVTGGAHGGRGCPVPGRPAAACNDAAVAEALAAIATALAASPQAKVYVHCARGEDRTGLVIAALRLARHGCPAVAAEREMAAYFYVPYPPLQAVWTKLRGSAP
jgi:hypothetical protein